MRDRAILYKELFDLYQFSLLGLGMKIRLRENFTSEIFTGENIPIYGIGFV